MIAVPIVAGTGEEARRQIEAAESVADVIELRIDYMQNGGALPFLEGRKRPMIVTCRGRRDGGAFTGSEEERIKLLQGAVDAGVEYVDVEVESFGKIRRRGKTKLIASWHDWEGTPGEEQLRTMHARLVATGADVVKLVTTARDVRDNIKLLKLIGAAGSKKPTIAFAMGEYGQVSRILTGKFGGYLTFGAIETGKESGPGQITARELREMYGYKSIGKKTKMYGVIAKPVAHSMSPAIMNAAFRETGLDAAYVPMLTEDAPATVKAFRDLGFAGYSVTLPHKETVMEELDEIDELARKIGAVNTIVRREDGKLRGTNTDVWAAVRSIEAAIGGKKGKKSPLAGKRVAIIGARGVARAIGFGTREAGAKVVIYNRTQEKAKELAGELGCEWGKWEEMGSLEADVIANATSVGMSPSVEESPVEKTVFKRGMVAFDAVYHPLETRFLAEAKEAGCVVVTGLEMFVGQAAEQFKLWTGKEAPVEVMRRVVVERLGGTS